eukprot:358593-Chlamydomonas_euryale.AAC.2
MQVPRWLHVHVRPSVHMLLRAVHAGARAFACEPGGVSSLMDGHWVLAFPNSEQAALARACAQEQAAVLRSAYADLLGGLITEGCIANGGGGAAALASVDLL